MLVIEHADANRGEPLQEDEEDGVVYSSVQALEYTFTTMLYLSRNRLEL